VSALVRGNGDAVSVFLDGCADNVQHAAVMPEVYDFRSLGLDQPAHDIDRGIVAVKQRGSGDET
jgi:hypothetical protein